MSYASMKMNLTGIYKKTKKMSITITIIKYWEKNNYLNITSPLWPMHCFITIYKILRPTLGNRSSTSLHFVNVWALPHLCFKSILEKKKKEK